MSEFMLIENMKKKKSKFCCDFRLNRSWFSFLCFLPLSFDYNFFADTSFHIAQLLFGLHLFGVFFGGFLLVFFCILLLPDVLKDL